MNHGTSDDERQALARMSLLGEASSWLHSSLDLEDTLRRVVALPVPSLADACVIQLLGQRSQSAPEAEAPIEFEQLIVTHYDRDTARRVNGLIGFWSSALHRFFGAQEVLHTGRAQAVRSLEHEPMPAHGEESEPSLMRELGASSYLALPLRARGRLIGVLSLVQSSSAHPERVPGMVQDRAFMEELASRASAAIDNARLYQQAQRAIAVRDDMLAVVSHDLQSPLNAISMTVKRLFYEPQISNLPAARRALELIERTTKHIGQLIAELLEVGSIQAGRLSLDKRPSALPALAADALAMLDPLVNDKQLRVSTSFDARLPPVYCDGERVMRVLMNLLGNAIKFSDQGGEVVVSARVVGVQVELSIRDTGAGIAREDLPKLFDPYWRSRQAGRRGMGLGLYIARGIVEAHGGHIWAVSELGVGSTFSFRLAIAPAEATYPE